MIYYLLSVLVLPGIRDSLVIPTPEDIDGYKRNVDDPRESPFYRLRDILENKGAVLSIFNSWLSSENTVASLDECIDGVKAIVIVTEHSDVIDKMSHLELSQTDVEVIVDGRNSLNGDLIKGQGVLYRGIGR